MSLYASPVPMPEKKITFKKAPNGTIYVYYTTRAYRNHKGKPTSDEVAIGKKDSESGMLIPNKRYHEFFPRDTVPGPMAGTTLLPHRIADYGNIFALMKLARETGLAGILERCFPSKRRELLAVAFYMLCEGNVMMYLEDWFDVTDISFAHAMGDRRCSEIFASISHDERMFFFEEWIKERQKEEYIAYDVTSISTWSTGIDIAEWGYNRDGESLPQVNLGMFYGATSRFPVYYTMYSGSIADKSHLVFMLESAGRLGIDKVRFVMDRGFVTQENLTYMEKNAYRFIVPFPLTRLEASSLIEAHGQSIRKASNHLSAFDLYGAAFDYELYGIRMKAHIFFDSEKQSLDEKELYARIAKLSEELEKMRNAKRIPKRYTDFFDVEKDGATALRFEMDREKIDERLKRTGFFILLTTDLSCSSEELIRIYRSRDEIEKNFDQLKNGLDFKRLRTHVAKTTEGKIFVGFLALILRTYLQSKLKACAQTKALTLGKVLLELKKIKTVVMPDMKKIVMPLTRMQKTILLALDIQPEELIDVDDPEVTV